MRSRTRDLQDVWFCNFSEVNVGMDRAKVFDKPFKKELSVSATSGLVFGWGAGLSLKYNRYITSYDRSMRDLVREGMAVFVDVEPKLDKNGELVVEKTYLTNAEGEIILDDDGEPTLIAIDYATQPDYIIEEIMDTKRGKVARYGIKKV